MDTAGPARVPGNRSVPGGVDKGESGGGELDTVDGTDDATAATRARAGDLDAYEVLVTRHTAAAHRTAVLFGAGDDADDVVQEAFVKAYRQLGRYRGESGFRPWLLAIVANETRNLHRSRTRRDRLALRVAARDGHGDGPEDPADAAAATARRQHLLDELRTLDDRDREVLVCRYLMDLSEAETATVLDLPKGTVKSRTARALTKLRTRFTAGGVEEVRGG